MRVLLASKSPRRRELLAGMGLDYRIVDIEADESFPPTLQAGDIPLFISRSKAEAYTAALEEDEVLVTADTIVWVEGEQLGKPQDEADAKRMLRMLSGRTHQVYTGVTLVTHEGMHSFVDQTDVCFRALTEAEIDHYVQTNRPLDKAGAYGIQEWIGYIGCTRLEGSYFNVMGLPTERLWEALSAIEKKI